MPLDWIDVTNLSFNTLLLLERVQLSWFPGWVAEQELAIALQGNPTVEWYLRHKCPEISSWLDKCLSAITFSTPPNAERIRQAEINILNAIHDLGVYVDDPAIYDAQPFLGWDSNELRSLTDFSGKIVIDIGSGTGRLAFIAAENALAFYVVEPVGNLRLYIKQKTRRKITQISTPSMASLLIYLFTPALPISPWVGTSLENRLKMNIMR